VTDRRSARAGAAVLGGVFALPLVALVVRAFADAWRAPDLLPQRIGARGFEVAFGGAGAGEAFVTSLAVAILAMGLAVLVGWPAALEEMARSYGASPSRRLAWVTLPSVAPTLAAAGLLGFLVSWRQYGSSLAVGAGRPMLPILMLPFIHTDPQVAAAFALLFLLPAVLALVVATRLSRSPL
jgi:putative spermidine/putrescine transport system permease protein